MPSTRENSTPRSVKRTLANSGLASGQGARSMPSSIATICSLGGTAGRDEGRWISSRVGICGVACAHRAARSEEHPSELQSLLRIAYAVFCLIKKTTQTYSILTLTLYYY